MAGAERLRFGMSLASSYADGGQLSGDKFRWLVAELYVVLLLGGWRGGPRTVLGRTPGTRCQGTRAAVGAAPAAFVEFGSSPTVPCRTGSER